MISQVTEVFFFSPIARPTTETASNDSLSSNESLNFRFFSHRPRRLEDTVLSERWDQEDIDNYLGVPDGWQDRPLAVKVYVDDLNNIEKVNQYTAISTISETKTILLPHARKSQANFERIKSRAEEVGMKVNSSKTQMLCISSNINYNVTSYIRTGGEEIRSTEELKILGFWFSNKPNVSLHVQKMAKKFRSRLWSLRHLKQSGMTPGDLLFVYTTVLRPVLDFAVPTYHPLLSIGQSQCLEKLQQKALYIVYGHHLSYDEALAVSNLTTLQERRDTLTLNFAQSTQKNPRYTDGWFPCLLYTSPSPRDLSTSRMPSSA